MLDKKNIIRRKNIKYASTTEINQHYFDRKITIDKELQFLKNKNK